MPMQRKHKSLYALIAALAWPTMVEQALGTVVQYVDTAMVGRMGAHASACVGLTASTQWLVNSPLWALATGVLACTARAVGAKDDNMARRTATQAVLLALISGCVIGVITLAVSPFLPAWLGAEEALRRDGSLYFAIVCAPMLFRAAQVIFSAAIQATGDTRTPMFINLGMNALNIVLNALFIFETRPVDILGFQFTMPGMGWGVIGAAAATAISYIFGGAAMTAMFWRNRYISPRGFRIRLDREAMLPCVRIGIPVVGSRVATMLGHVVFTSLVTSLGTTALASHTIAITAEQAFYIPGYGMQAAASTLAGQSLGEGDEKKLRRVSRTIMLVTMAMMTVTGAILFAIPDRMMSLFTPDAAVVAGGIQILRIVAVSEPIYGMSIILEGTFNGVGDTKAPFVISLACMWGIRILFTWICVKALGLGLVPVWLCMVADNVMRGALLAVRYARGKWLTEAFSR
ncbi:MAG: MATE family efflux transporter [Clostridia bacterium]|nr:MATE family efflux transporter [Clostridia bacterium]